MEQKLIEQIMVTEPSLLHQRLKENVSKERFFNIEDYTGIRGTNLLPKKKKRKKIKN